MMPLNPALEANNLGRILDLFMDLLLVDLGIVIVIGNESMSSLVIGEFLHSQHIVKCGLPFMTLIQVFLQRSDLGLELFDSLYMVSINTRAGGSGCIIIRETRQGKQFITRCGNIMDRKSTRLNSSHRSLSRMPSSA